jgi:hypothetical protein
MASVLERFLASAGALAPSYMRPVAWKSRAREVAGKGRAEQSGMMTARDAGCAAN